MKVFKDENEDEDDSWEKQRPGGAFNLTRPANCRLQVRIARGQHGGEPRRFFLATAALARLFKMPMAAHGFQRAFAIDFLFQSPQRFINGLAFF